MPGRRGRAMRGQEAKASLHHGDCSFEAREGTNLLELMLPKEGGTAVDAEQGGRCGYRHADLSSALVACTAVAACVGVSRDNGLRCGGARKAYELRAGSPTPAQKTASWTCPARIKPVQQLRRLDDVHFSDGVIFILLGGCGERNYQCGFVREALEAVQSVRAVLAPPKAGRRSVGIGILTDGGVPAEWLMKNLEPDIVQPLTFSTSVLDDDLRAKKLLAYPQTPFKRTVFMDGDTFVLRPIDDLFEALTRFDLAAAFECCRLNWANMSSPYDYRGFMKGWEMQTGVMAYRRSARVAQFWQLAYDEYVKAHAYWRGRSSGEQGAATYALGESDVRFMPLPPAFNARPYTLYQWVEPYGVSIYHGKELYKHEGLDGETLQPRQVIKQRMLRDWQKAAARLEKVLS